MHNVASYNVSMQRYTRLTIAPSGTDDTAERASASHASAKVNAALRADVIGRAYLIHYLTMYYIIMC